jgi:hypothetical protein
MGGARGRVGGDRERWSGLRGRTRFTYQPVQRTSNVGAIDPPRLRHGIEQHGVHEALLASTRHGAGMAEGHWIRQGPELAQPIEDCLKTFDLSSTVGRGVIRWGQDPLRPPPDDGGWRRWCASHLEHEVFVAVPVLVQAFEAAGNEAAQSTRSRTHPSWMGTTTAGASSPQPKNSSEPPGSSETSATCCHRSSGWSGALSHTSAVTAVVPKLAGCPDRHEATVGDHRCASYPASVVWSRPQSVVYGPEPRR